LEIRTETTKKNAKIRRSKNTKREYEKERVLSAKGGTLEVTKRSCPYGKGRRNNPKRKLLT